MTITTIVQNVNSRRTSVVLGEAEKVLYGKGFILDILCGKTYAISPRSFYQINHAQTEVLYGLAVDAAKLTGKEVVLDAYCGIGTIGLTAADHAKQVVGVELNRDAVHDAIGNAKHNGVKNARFCRRCHPVDRRGCRRRRAGRRDLYGPAAGGLYAAVYRKRGPHGPEACGVRQLQPGHAGPGS